MSSWISDWNPEDESFWESKGKLIARRNLFWSILAEHCITLTWWYYMRKSFLAQRAPATLAEAGV